MICVDFLAKCFHYELLAIPVYLTNHWIEVVSHECICFLSFVFICISSMN